MKMGREELLTLLRLVNITEPEEIDCGEFLSRVGAYLEKLEASGEAAVPGSENLIHHLRICPECLEEFEALYEAYREGI